MNETKRIEGRREPEAPQSYGASADRFNAERELGRRVLTILSPEHNIELLDKLADIRFEAERLGLLPEGGAS